MRTEVVVCERFVRIDLAAHVEVIVALHPRERGLETFLHNRGPQSFVAQRYTCQTGWSTDLAGCFVLPQNGICQLADLGRGHELLGRSRRGGERAGRRQQEVAETGRGAKTLRPGGEVYRMVLFRSE